MSVLAWHQVVDLPLPTAVTPRRFAAQIDLLADMGLQVGRLDAGDPGKGAVALTFDDGHRDTYTAAYPLLAARGLTATLYVATGFVSTEDWFEAGGHAVTWTMLRELHGAGWRIGSHTVSHRRLVELDDADLERELVASRAALEDALGAACEHFCAPYGDMDARVLEAVHRAGYRTAAVSVPVRHPLPQDPLIIHRSGVYRSTSWWAFRLKARGWDASLRRRRRRGGPAGPPV